MRLNSKIRAASAAFLILFAAGCGLPSYSYLDEPSVIDYGSSNKVGFNAADGSGVDGYIIYYKIYADGDEDIDDDEDRFDASYYDDDSIPDGTTVPESLSFEKMAWAGVSSYTTPVIGYDGDDDVVLDFTSSINQDSGNDPVLYIDGSSMSSSMGIPGRGVKDSDSLYKRFVQDYDFDDSDLDSTITGGSTIKIQIAFVAISYGLDASTLDSSMSVPVYLGTVYQTNFEETEDN